MSGLSSTSCYPVWLCANKIHRSILPKSKKVTILSTLTYEAVKKHKLTDELERSHNTVNGHPVAMNKPILFPCKTRFALKLYYIGWEVFHGFISSCKTRSATFGIGSWLLLCHQQKSEIRSGAEFLTP